MDQLDSNKVFSGFRLGLLIGGAVALFKAPRISIFRQRNSEEGSTVNSLMKRVQTVDPIAKSIAEGKEAARLRREELGRNA